MESWVWSRSATRFPFSWRDCGASSIAATTPPALRLLDHGRIARLRTVGKVKVLQDAWKREPLRRGESASRTPVGRPMACPTTRQRSSAHVSRDGVAIVHNGIIENHETLRAGTERVWATTSPPKRILKSSPTAFTITSPLPRICSRRYAKRSPNCKAPTRSRWCARRIRSASCMAREGCPGGARTRHRRELRGLGRGRACCRSRAASCFWKKATSRRCGASRSRSWTRPDSAASVPCGKANCRRTPWSAVSTATSCSRKSTSSRARSRRRLEERVAGGKFLDAAFGPAAAGSLQAGEGGAHCRLRHQLITPASWPAISSSRSAASRPASKSRANTATAIR